MNNFVLILPNALRSRRNGKVVLDSARPRLTLSDMVRLRRVEVRDPDLRLWRVGRRWSPWRPRMRNIRLRIDDGLNFGSAFDDISAGVAVAVLVFVLVVLTSPLAGLGVFFAEWMLALLLIPIAVAYRTVFHRPWHLCAASADGRDLFAVAVRLTSP